MIASVASGLGGRFFDELRDKRSLCYTVNAFALGRRLAGAFGAYIATSPEQEDAARQGLLAEFRRLRDRARPEDTVVLFLAGHTAMFQGEFQLLLPDFRFPKRSEGPVASRGGARGQRDDLVSPFQGSRYGSCAGMPVG